MRPKEINLADLLVNILLHWRMFIIWMLAGATLFWGVSFIHFRNMYQEQQSMLEKIQFQPGNLLSEEEMQNVNYVIDYETMYRSRETYLEKSLLMKIDPNYVSKAEAIILIEAETDQESCQIKRTYENIIQSGELVQKVASSIGTEAIGIDATILLGNEPVASEIISEADNTYDVKMTNNIIENANSFRITVMHNDENQCKDMLENIIKFLEEKQPDIESALGSHEIVVIDQSFGIVSDARVAERQKNVLTDILVMKKTIKDLKDKLSDRELQYYDLLTGSEEITDVIAPPTTYSLGDGVKYILLGIITAVFLYTFILVFIYILNNKVRVTDDLQKLYDIPKLGVIPGEEKKQKMFGFVDRWILSLYGRNKQRLSREEAMEYTSVSIKMSAGKEKLREVYFVGCRMDGSALDTCEKIVQRLCEEDFHTDILNDILYDAQELNKLGKAEGVILAIYAGSTRYSEIVEELELLTRQGMKMLGAFILA